MKIEQRSGSHPINNSIVLLIVVLSVGLCGCNARELAAKDLSNATRLHLGPGTRFERIMEGEELAEYISTFIADTDTDLRMVHNVQRGIIEIDGKEYPIEYAEGKIASRPAIIKIKTNGNHLRFIQEKPPVKPAAGHD